MQVCVGDTPCCHGLCSRGDLSPRDAMMTCHGDMRRAARPSLVYDDSLEGAAAARGIRGVLRRGLAALTGSCRERDI